MAFIRENQVYASPVFVETIQQEQVNEACSILLESSLE
jgi:hypothetical protein